MSSTPHPQPMADFVAQFSGTPLFGLTATLCVYMACATLYRRLDAHPLANPILTSVALLVALLLTADIPYERYFAGAQFIHFLLGPAVVALAWPLWQRRSMLWRYRRALLAAALVGGVVGAGSAVLLGWALGLPPEVLRSLAPKAMTSPVAIGVAQSIGGQPELTAMLVLVTGLIGAVGAQYVLNAIGEHSWAVRGFAIGTQAHGFGTARALYMHPEAGAYAGLALGIQAILGAILIPLLAHWLG